MTKYMTFRALCEFLKIPNHKAAVLMRQGLPYRTVYGQFVFDTDEVLEWAKVPRRAKIIERPYYKGEKEMGTRGVFGVRIDGKDKLGYNHYDSYPSALGVSLVAEIGELMKEGLDAFRERARALRQVNESDAPTPEELTKFEKYRDPTVNGGRLTWYGVIRELQGNLRDTLYAGVMLDSNWFIQDGLSCEFGYIVNLDDETFEVYEGCQTKPHAKGRYGSDVPQYTTASYPGSPATSFYAAALVGTFPLHAIPKDWIAQCGLSDEE